MKKQYIVNVPSSVRLEAWRTFASPLFRYSKLGLSWSTPCMGVRWSSPNNKVKECQIYTYIVCNFGITKNWPKQSNEIFRSSKGWRCHPPAFVSLLDNLLEPSDTMHKKSEYEKAKLIVSLELHQFNFHKKYLMDCNNFGGIPVHFSENKSLKSIPYFSSSIFFLIHSGVLLFSHRTELTYDTITYPLL